MDSDGANMGVKPARALETILGGKDQPKEEERLSSEGMRSLLLSQPDDYKDISEDYDSASLWLAKQFFLILESDFEEDYNKLYDEMKKKNGEQDYDFTGFMVGWANNAARYALNKPSHRNPAIVEIQKESNDKHAG